MFACSRDQRTHAQTQTQRGLLSDKMRGRRPSHSDRTAASFCRLFAVAVALCWLAAGVRAQSVGSIRLTEIRYDPDRAVPAYFPGGGDQVATYSRGLLEFYWNGAWGVRPHTHTGGRQLTWTTRQTTTRR